MITENHLRVRRTARYCVLGGLNSETVDVWIVCHGFGQLAREFISAFEPVAKAGRAIVAPEALSRFYKSQGAVHAPDTPVGATWMTREDRKAEIDDYVAYLDSLLTEIREKSSADVRVSSLGFSQGAATVSRWVAASRPSLMEVVLWGGLLPPEFADPESLGGLMSQPLRFVCGTEDRYINSGLAAAELRRMQLLGLPVQWIAYPGGHSIDPVSLVSLMP